MGAAPSVSLAGAPPGAMVNPGFRPVMMRPPGAVFTSGPPAVISSPGLARMPVAIATGGMRPVFIGKRTPLKTQKDTNETSSHAIESLGLQKERAGQEEETNVKKGYA